MLKIKNLDKTYPNGVQALKNINLEISKGVFGLLGENGSGKSTLMRIISTLQSGDSGSVFFNNIDILNNPSGLRPKLGYLPQSFGVYPNVSIETMLNHVAKIKGNYGKNERNDYVDFLLNKVNLYDKRKVKLGTSSGGMKQRFGIAQAIIGDPELIIVDEPTNGLDPKERNQLYFLLSELGEKSTVILSTHIVDDIANLCSQIAILKKGEILEKGNPSDLVELIKNKVYRKKISRKDLLQESNKHDVLYPSLKEGGIYINVVGENCPQEFTAYKGTLEDFYFYKIK
jgi:ABC-type multidrug transport system ATPase subunit